jgi:hypothetical protein
MNTISTTEARENLGGYLNELANGTAEAFVIGRRNAPEAVLVKFPALYSKKVSDITNINTYSRSFDFLNDEPDLYSEEDVI